MLHIFRKIRHKLVAENKTAKYLRYAVGEIILVVLGILIALQINNWNEENKTNKSIGKHLVILKQNLLEDQEQLRELQQNMEIAINSSDSAFMQIKTLIPVDNQMKKYLVVLLLEHQFSPNLNAMETLTQSNEIPYLNANLQTAILNYYALIEDTKKREHISNTQIQTKYEILINNNYPEIFQGDNGWKFIQTIYRDDPRPVKPLDAQKLVNDKKLEAHLVSRNYQCKTLKKFYTELLAASDSILTILQKEY